MSTTIKDVARLANVSISTVSHVINCTKPVGGDARRRVEEAVKASQYVPHQIARSLRKGQTKTVGLVVSDTSQYMFGRVIGEIEGKIREAGYNLLLANSAEDREQETRCIRTFLDNRVEGLVVAPSADFDPENFVACDQAGVPYVLVDRTPDARADQVGTDNQLGMRALTNHLIAKGHTDIALIAGDVGVWTLKERERGFRVAMADAGLEVDPAVVLTTGRGLSEGTAEIMAFLRVNTSSTAVIVASALLTRGALHAIRQLGASVPGDLALASFDGLMNAEFIEPRLTAVLHPVEFIGREATALLLRRIADPDVPASTIRADPIIDHGTSCGCPPGTRLTLSEALAR